MKAEAYKFKLLGEKQYQERRAQGTEPNDLFSHLIAGNKQGQFVPPIALSTWRILILSGLLAKPI